MRKLFLLASLALPSLMIATPASAEWYAKVNVGQTFDTEVSGLNLSEDLAYGAAIGTTLGPFRLEAGAQRLNANADLGFMAINADAVNYSGSIYLDLPVTENASLFGGVGLDYMQAEASTLGYSISEEGDGWHASIGASYDLSENLVFEGQVTRLDVELDTFDVETWNAMAGLRFKLN